LGHTDRYVAKVIDIAPDGKTVTVQYFDAKADPSKNNDMGHQNWIFEPTEIIRKLVWKYGSWRAKYVKVVYTTEHINKATQSGLSTFEYLKSIGKYDEVYGECPFEMKLVKGVTQIKKEYKKISVIFNVCNYYYDWEF